MMGLFSLQREKNKKGLVNLEKFYVFKISKVSDIWNLQAKSIYFLITLWKLGVKNFINAFCTFAFRLYCF